MGSGYGIWCFMIMTGRLGYEWVGMDVSHTKGFGEPAEGSQDSVVMDLIV